MVSLRKKKVISKQGTDAPCSSIVLEFDYNVQYILPIEQGTAILGALAYARRLKSEYQKPKKILDGAGKLQTCYMPEQEIKEIILADLIDPEENSDEEPPF